MLFSSAHFQLRRKNIDYEKASEDALMNACWTLIQRDAKLGVNKLRECIRKFRHTPSNRMLFEIQQDDPARGQILQLVGTDAARHVCERKLNISLALYYPCTLVVARQHNTISLSAREQAYILSRAELTAPDTRILEKESNIAGAIERWFATYCPRGTDLVQALIDDAKRGGGHATNACNPESNEGQEYAAILGTHFMRRVFEERHGVRLSFLHECRGSAEVVTERARHDARPDAHPDPVIHRARHNTSSVRMLRAQIRAHLPPLSDPPPPN